jgi:hypothetical protein
VLHEDADRHGFDDELLVASQRRQHGERGAALTVGQVGKARFDRHARRADVGAPNAEAAITMRAGPH